MSIFKKTIFIIFGTMLTGFAISVFYLPNKIVNGGVSGIATLTYHILGIEPGITYVIVNLFLFVIALIVLGKRFIVRSLLGTACLSLFVQVFSYIPPLTDNLFLSVVFGGALYGLGISIVFTQGGSTGGTDILGRLIENKFSQIPIGTLLLIVDGTIVVISLILFGNIELALYGIIALVISTFSIQMLINRMNSFRLVLIITDYGEKISNFLILTSPRGCTKIKATGAYTNTQKHVLLCALKANEIPSFMDKVKKLDENAFCIFLQSRQIVGNGFYVYH